jgi:hypothetical protein
MSRGQETPTSTSALDSLVMDNGIVSPACLEGEQSAMVCDSALRSTGTPDSPAACSCSGRTPGVCSPGLAPAGAGLNASSVEGAHSNGARMAGSCSGAHASCLQSPAPSAAPHSPSASAPLAPGPASLCSRQAPSSASPAAEAQRAPRDDESPHPTAASSPSQVGLPPCADAGAAPVAQPTPAEPMPARLRPLIALAAHGVAWGEGTAVGPNIDAVGFHIDSATTGPMGRATEAGGEASAARDATAGSRFTVASVRTVAPPNSSTLIEDWLPGEEACTLMEPSTLIEDDPAASGDEATMVDSPLRPAPPLLPAHIEWTAPVAPWCLTPYSAYKRRPFFQCPALPSLGNARRATRIAAGAAGVPCWRPMAPDGDWLEPRGRTVVRTSLAAQPAANGRCMRSTNCRKRSA